MLSNLSKFFVDNFPFLFLGKLRPFLFWGNLPLFSFGKEKRGRGQASFELLLLVAFIFSLSFILTAYFFQESDKTRVEAMAKSIVLKELNKDGNFHLVNSVEFDSGAVTVCLKPSNLCLDSKTASSITAEVSQIPSVTGLSILYTDFDACTAGQFCKPVD